MRERHLESGKRYKITMDDCCIQGEFIGTFLRWENVNPSDSQNEPLMYATAVFDIGSIEPGWGAWTTEEISKESE